MDGIKESANILSQVSNGVVEFIPNSQEDKIKQLVSTAMETDSLPATTDGSTQSNETLEANTQTDIEYKSSKSDDDQKLALWLRKIYPKVEAELSKGLKNVSAVGNNFPEAVVRFRPYQTLPQSTTIKKNFIHGDATWLSVRIDNVPAVVVACTDSHSGWCDHVDQDIKIFSPKRVQDYIAFSLVGCMPVKACISSLCTNTFSKDIFAGGTVLGDLYIWQFETQKSDVVKELSHEVTESGCIIDMTWLEVHALLTCHSEIIILWNVGKKLIKDRNFAIRQERTANSINEGLTSILAITSSEFVVGSENGRLILCTINQNLQYNSEKNIFYPIQTELEPHKFQVNSLLKSTWNGVDVIVSCDLSGEVYFHSIRNIEDGPTLIYKIPLPFKNSVGCSKTADYIFCAVDDGGLEVYSTHNGNTSTVLGKLSGKANIIKISENGKWIIIGTYEGQFQIFSAVD